MSVTTRRSQALRQFATYVTELDRILYLSIQGMVHVAGSVELAVAVSEYERYLDPALDAEAEEKRLEEVRLRATFAQEEMERGYPVLHAHSAVALWGALETLFNLTVAWIRDDPTVLSDERLSSIKISLAEYTRLDEENRVSYLVEELSRRLKVDFQAGVSRFEGLLDVVGLSGPVAEEVRKDLFELFHIRNVLVHRAGIVDRRFCIQCPSSNLSVGDKITVTHGDYLRFLKSIHLYAVELMKRDLVRQGKTREEAEERLAKYG